MPSVCVRLDDRLRATALGTYFSSRIARVTRSRVSGATLSCPLITRDTVWCDTLAFLATSRIVARFTNVASPALCRRTLPVSARRSLLTVAGIALCYRSHQALAPVEGAGKEGADDPTCHTPRAPEGGRRRRRRSRGRTGLRGLPADRHTQVRIRQGRRDDRPERIQRQRQEDPGRRDQAQDRDRPE